MLNNPGATHPSRPLRMAAWLVRILLWLVVTAWCLLALSWGVLHGWIVPRVSEWRPALETLATRSLGVRVEVGAVSATSSGPVPAITLSDVRLLDAAGREALHLPAVQTALSVRSLWRLGFEQVLIESPVVSVRRTADGRIQVGGLDVTQGGDDGGRIADWVFSQTEWAVRGGELRWTDDTRPQAPTLVLAGLDFVSRNRGRQHDWRLDATPPPDWGQRFSLRGRFSGPLFAGRPGDWRAWSGTLYVEAPFTDLRQLHTHADLEALWRVTDLAGRGITHAWLDVKRGQPAALTLDLDWADVALAMQPVTDPLALDALQGRLEWQRAEDGRVRVATRALAFKTADGFEWPGGDLVYEQQTAADGTVTEWQAQAERVDLQALQRLAPRLPLPAQWRELAESTQPQGRAEALSVRWRAGQDERAEQWSASGRLRQLVLSPAPTPPAVLGADGETEHPLARPGLRGVDLDLDMDEAGGRAQVQVRDGALSFPGVFQEPEIPLDRLKAEVRWRVNGEQLGVDVTDLSFANADAEGQGRVRWRTADPATGPVGRRFPGVLDLDLRMPRANGARVHRYLPQAIPPDVRRYLQAAVLQAEARDARFLVNGDLWDFPFASPGTGQFDVRAKLSDVVLAYVPEHLRGAEEPAWPALARLEADLHIDRVALNIGAARGVVQSWPQLKTVRTEARIPDFTAAAPVLQVRGQVQGPGPDALAFVNTSPLSPLLGHVLRDARLQGPVNLQLGLDLPLNDVAAVRVNGQLRLANNDLQVTPDSPWLRASTGALDFNEQGFRVPQASARLLGGEVRLAGGMERRNGQAVVKFQAQGQVSAEGLRQAAEVPAAGWAMLAALGRQATGGTAYRAQLEFAPEGQSVLVESSLQGLALNLPSPLGKTGPEPLPMRYEVAALPPAGAGGGSLRDRLTLELGTGPAPLLSARYEREHAANATRVLRGALSWRTERPPLPASGVQGQFNLGDFDVGAWDQWAGLAMPGSAGSDAHRGYWPTDFGLAAERLRHGGREFHDVVAGGGREGDTWRLSVAARELNGYLEYRPSAAAPGRVYARLARLTLPPATATEVENLLQSQPRTVPALDVVVEDFELNDRRLGRLQIEAVNRQAAVSAQESVREWRLNTLSLTVPEARLQASGNWAAQAGAREGMPRRTALKVQLQIDDAGALLARFGMAGVIRGGKGTLGGNVGWLGSPLSMDVPSLSGELELDLQRGQFLKADPGIAKLLGVLSLQSLPRRLVLDFRDVFSEGFAFDAVRGNARIAQGVASTNNLQMKGVSAAVLIEGEADIARETQDITAVVIPELNAGTASLLATAINPVTGIGTFLAQFLLRQPLQEAATQQFRITGPWADPKVEKVNRRNIPAENGAVARPGAPP